MHAELAHVTERHRGGCLGFEVAELAKRRMDTGIFTLTELRGSIRQSERALRAGFAIRRSNKTPMVGCRTVTRVPVLTCLASGGKSEPQLPAAQAGQRPPAMRTARRAPI